MSIKDIKKERLFPKQFVLYLHEILGGGISLEDEIPMASLHAFSLVFVNLTEYIMNLEKLCESSGDLQGAAALRMVKKRLMETEEDETSIEGTGRQEGPRQGKAV